jgi:hypothetical protein
VISSDLVKLYLQLYEGELKARDYVISALAPFISTLTLLVGATLYFLIEWPSGPAPRSILWAFIALFVIGVFAIMVGIGSALATVWSREYGYLPGLGAIEQWRKENEVYHQTHPSEMPSLEDRLNGGLAGELASAAEQNRAANRARGAHAHRAKICTSVALICYAVAIVPFAVVHHGLGGRSIIQQPTSLPMTDKDTSNAPVKPTSAPKEPQKTPFPPKENLREGHDKATVKRDK